MDSQSIREKHRKYVLPSVINCYNHGNSLRIAPALNVGRADVDRATEILDAAFATVR